MRRQGWQNLLAASGAAAAHQTRDGCRSVRCAASRRAASGGLPASYRPVAPQSTAPLPARGRWHVGTLGAGAPLRQSLPERKPQRPRRVSRQLVGPLGCNGASKNASTALRAVCTRMETLQLSRQPRRKPWAIVSAGPDSRELAYRCHCVAWPSLSLVQQALLSSLRRYGALTLQRA